MKKWIKCVPVILAAVLLFGLLAGCGGNSGEGSAGGNIIRIVHKNYTEQRLIGQVLSTYLESLGYQTKVSELGGTTMLCYGALKNGEADLYAEYTGTAYSGIWGKTEKLSAEETYKVVKEASAEDGITWLEPFGFNNTYVLSVRQETADQYNLKTISDLIPYAGEMRIGSEIEFSERGDGYPGLLQAYPGLAFKEYIPMDQGLTYDALRTGDLEVNVSYSTDGRIAKFHFVNLEDDAHFFPPYYCAPIITNQAAEAHPDLIPALEKLNNIWTEEDMQQYNLKVDEGADLKEVAAEMLTQAGLLDA